MNEKSSSETYFNTPIEKRLSDGLWRDAVVILKLFYDSGSLTARDLSSRLNVGELNTRGDSYSFLITELRGSGYLKGNLDGKLEITDQGKLYSERIQSRPKVNLIVPEVKREAVIRKLEKQLAAV